MRRSRPPSFAVVVVVVVLCDEPSSFVTNLDESIGADLNTREKDPGMAQNSVTINTKWGTCIAVAGRRCIIIIWRFCFRRPFVPETLSLGSMFIESSCCAINGDGKLKQKMIFYFFFCNRNVTSDATLTSQANKLQYFYFSYHFIGYRRIAPVKLIIFAPNEI